MIDEKVLIERLKDEERDYRRRWKYKGENEEDWQCMKAMQKAIKITEQLAEEHNNGWISVDDVLPGECEIVLFCTKYGYVRQGSRHIRYEHNTYDLAGVTHTFSDDEIIAWKPLPEIPAPYKKGE